MRNVVLLLCVCGLALAAEPAGTPAAPAAPAVPDEVIFKDGTVIKGEIVSMTESTITIKTAVGEKDQVIAKWGEVAGIKTAKATKFVLKDGTELMGSAKPGEAGKIDIASDLLVQPATVALDSIAAVNPPEKKAITFRGNVSVGASAARGNTNTSTVSLLALFEARSDRQRLTISGEYNYGETDNELTQRNAKGRIQYDFFVTKRFYVFASALFEGDKFEDLNLRTALSAGPGYQFIDIGDFEGAYLDKMQLRGELGVSYFNEDFKSSPDSSYVAGRWGLKFEWPITPWGTTLFHNDEGYPSFEHSADFYVTTQQGVRFNLVKNFVAGFQVNWDYDNTPAPGRKNADVLYLLTVGYNFDL
jgi:putative salt-induced outer membrane protein YdiY